MKSENENHRSDPSDSGGFSLTSALLCGVTLLVGGGLIAYIYSSEPTASRTTATKESAMPVEVVRVKKGTYRPTIDVQGTVQPARDIILRPRVSGEVMNRSKNFTPGGFVTKGEMLVRLDPADYQNALKQRQSELREAEKDLKLEMGRQEVAKKEFNLLGESLSEEDRELVLRKPQLNAARAQVESARAAVEQAKLELERTKIKAPFDAQILTRDVNIGSQVAAGDQLARLVGVKKFWVEAMVPLSDLRWLSFREDGDELEGSSVRIRNRTAWSESEFRTGHIDRQIGTVSRRTRMATVLVTVRDPLSRNTNPERHPPLIIGSYVQVHIKGKRIQNAVRVRRDYVHENDTIWVYADGLLEVRDVSVAFRDGEYAYVRDGLSEGDRIVTTSLTTVADGAKLRIKDASSDPSTNGSE